tara:strand:+ start:188 stop:469 length:282 start_codon:yes stop_codon:yes gene_type:complete
MTTSELFQKYHDASNGCRRAAAAEDAAQDVAARATALASLANAAALAATAAHEAATATAKAAWAERREAFNKWDIAYDAERASALPRSWRDIR